MVQHIMPLSRLLIQFILLVPSLFTFEGSKRLVSVYFLRWQRYVNIVCYLRILKIERHICYKKCRESCRFGTLFIFTKIRYLFLENVNISACSIQPSKNCDHQIPVIGFASYHLPRVHVFSDNSAQSQLNVVTAMASMAQTNIQIHALLAIILDSCISYTVKKKTYFLQIFRLCLELEKDTIVCPPHFHNNRECCENFTMSNYILIHVVYLIT